MCRHKIITYGCSHMSVDDEDSENNVEDILCEYKIELNQITAKIEPRRRGDSHLIRLQTRCEEDAEKGDVHV